VDDVDVEEDRVGGGSEEGGVLAEDGEEQEGDPLLMITTAGRGSLRENGAFGPPMETDRRG
jgi:hypothetical protein